MIAEIKFACSYCGQKIAVQADAAGIVIDCPNCQEPVTIPQSPMVSEPWRPDGGLREKIAALQSECERLSASATHTQAELKSFQTERLTLRNEAAALKQRAAAAEAQLGEMPLLRQRFEVAETQLASLEQERAENHAALSRALEECAAAARELEGVRSQLATAQAEVNSLQTRFATASGEVESLRGLMNREETSRELLSTRTKLTAAEEELRERRQSATQLEMDLLKAEAERDRLDEERAGLHRRMAESLKQVEDLSGDRLNADNAKLRELLDRQNEQLKSCFRDLTRFRHAKLALKIVWALTALAGIGLGYFFVKVLPTIEWVR